MHEIYLILQEMIRQRQPAALVTVIDTRGSTPRGPGAKMLVQPDGTIHGTIGGSTVEAMVIEESKKCLYTGQCRKVTHHLDEAGRNDTGMICGGTMEFFIEPVNAPPLLYIFGGGHVALPLARLAGQVGFAYMIIEDREEFASRSRFPDACEIRIGKPDEIARQLPLSEKDYIAIVSRSHETDYLVLREVIRRSFHYLGIIGSVRKRQQFFSRLREEGIPEDRIAAVHTPIGLEIHAESPEEIAVSIVAELIKIKNS